MNKKIFVFVMAIFFVTGIQAFGVTTHTIKTGDTLWELSAKHYGDPTLYPILLEVNNIDNPRTIPNGKVIIIPNKADMQKIAKESDPAKKRDLIKAATGGKSSVVPPVDDNSGNSANSSSNSSADSVSRGGEAVDPDDTSFINILKGPKVSPDKLIKIENP